ncbi:MAG: 30S ribosomal protein S6 [Planctomycetota bacterium]|nr:30S ribosomal protein S6 [Planctomycetota bacterium]
MAKKYYECMCLLDSNRFSRDQAGVSSKLSETVTELGGEVLVSRLFVEQKLAYSINGHRKGSYWLMYIVLDGDSITDLNRQFQLNDNVMRHLVVNIDEKLIDTLVAIAKGEASPVKHEIDKNLASNAEGSY